MADYWFRPKRFGYGATPITWEGWALTLGSMVVVMGAVGIAVASQILRWPISEALIAAAIAVTAVTLAAAISVTRRKTDGEWRWRP